MRYLLRWYKRVAKPFRVCYIKRIMNITTNRLIIRNFRLSDAEDLYCILGDTETMQYLEPAYSFEKTRQFLQNFCIAKNGAFAVEHIKTGKVIGYLLFNECQKSVYEIGWIINKSFWRQGFAYEACAKLISYAFSEMNVDKIIGETIDTCKAVRLMKKLGMKLEEIQKNATNDSNGNLTNMYVYSISRTDNGAK